MPLPPPTDHCDVAIIGAGTAGLAAERAARAQGAETRLIDPRFEGTLCATAGCMPAKLLVAAAHAAHASRQAAGFGIITGPIGVDTARVMARVRRERDRFARMTREGFEKLPDGVCLRAEARFLAPGLLRLEGGSAEGTVLKARAVVIATGSTPIVAPPYRKLGAAMLTTNDLFELTELPRRMAVIGSGPVGLEIAQALGRLGVETTLFDRAERLSAARCRQTHEAACEALRADLTLHLGVDVTPTGLADGVRLDWHPCGDADGTGGSARFDRVLVATGRKPVLEGLDLGAAGLDLDDDGVPELDSRTMQCGTGAVFIAGDAAGDRPLLHEASDEGAIAGRNAATYPDVASDTRGTPFALTFTDPPLAMIGDAEGAISAEADYSDQGRARVEGRAHGLVRIHADARGRLVGADLCAPGTEHLAHHLAWAVQTGMTAPEMLALPFYHPTLQEGLRPALREICKRAELPEPKLQDQGAPSGA